MSDDLLHGDARPRRRHAAWLIPVGIAVVVAAALSITYVALRPSCDGPFCVRAAAPGPDPGQLRWLPAHLAAQAAPPPLPSDRGVGPGSLVYIDQTDREVLVTADQAQYTLPRGQGAPIQITHGPVGPTGPPRPIPSVTPLSLSPDGRWLLTVDGGRLALRDLTSTRSAVLTGGSEQSVVIWGAGLVLIQNPKVYEVTVVDLSTLQPHEVPLRGQVCGVQASTQLVACSPHGEPFTLSLVDSSNGAVRATVPVNVADSLTPDEEVGEQQYGQLSSVVLPLAGGQSVAVRTHPYHRDAEKTFPGDLILVDVATGTFRGRVALPPETAGQGVPRAGGIGYRPAERRDAVADVSEGIALVHIVPQDDPDFFYSVRVTGVEVADPATGRRSEVMTVNGIITRLILRGTYQ
jgi:hypothetical protein